LWGLLGPWPGVSDVSPTDGGETAGLIEKNLEKANIEYRMMNVECRSKAFYPFLLKLPSKAKPYFEILRFLFFNFV